MITPNPFKNGLTLVLKVSPTPGAIGLVMALVIPLARTVPYPSVLEKASSNKRLTLNKIGSGGVTRSLNAPRWGRVEL